jgi:anti-sigma B factor antagonist
MTTPHIDSTYLARDVLCVAVVGDIDIASADSLDEALGAALGAGGITRVMVDMQRTTFLDSAGIRTLLASRQKADELDIVFRIMNSPPIVRRVLELTGVYELLTDDV